MLERKLYIERLRRFVDKEQVKILTGIRRSGKSTLLRLLEQDFIHKGIEEDSILFIDLESFKHIHINDSKALYQYVEDYAKGKDRLYLLIDEVQEINEWEKAIKSFLIDFDIDIYLTGSNAYLLSSELSTYLAGRYISIPVYTLSFDEYLQFRKEYFSERSKNLKKAFMEYLRLGGFPVIHTVDYSVEDAYQVVYDIYSSVLLRDTVQRFKIRDIELLERVVKYAMDNIGNTFSGKNIADYFKSQQRRIDINTVYNYLYALESAFILHKVNRYDIKGKEILKTQEKYYLSDISLLYATMGFKDRKVNALLENIVFLELRRRGYEVFIGKLNNQEIDFVAQKRNKKLYIQVAYKLSLDQTIEREFSNLLAIKDNYPKYVVTMDESWSETIDGVQHFHISDFLLAKFY